MDINQSVVTRVRKVTIHSRNKKYVLVQDSASKLFYVWSVNVFLKKEEEEEETNIIKQKSIQRG
jgi:hypothetical protein